MAWSSSRIMGSFIVCQELNTLFCSCEKKRAMQGPTSKTCLPHELHSGAFGNANGTSGDGSEPLEVEKHLVRLPFDISGLSMDGLVKKTMSIIIQGARHDLVSYYSVQDIALGRLRTPSQAKIFESIHLRPELVSRLNFQAPFEDLEDVVGEKE